MENECKCVSMNLTRKHGRGWEGAASKSDAVDRTSVPRLSFFFFLGFAPNRLRFAPNRLRFAPNRADSARIRSYRPYRVVLAGDRYGRNRLKSVLKLAGAAEILTSDVFLAFFFLYFVNQAILMCFLRIF